MASNFASALKSTTEETITDPEEIFRKQASGKNLWIGQGDILRNWYINRNEKDILIAMDTGMGKTIVGLLIAHSLMNEKKQKIVYLCASKQLVEQTVKEAQDLGINVSSYSSREYLKEFDFHECKAPLVTTYQALFNGKSKFSSDEDIGGIVFDDSHVSGSVLKDSFTLNISKDKPLYTQIANLFTSYFDSQQQDVRYKNILEAKSEEVFILPSFELKNHLETIKQYFTDAKINDDKDMLFSWEYLQDKLDLCLFLINKKRIEIVPPVIPSKFLRYFQDNVSRVYLSATHVGKDYFPKYYGNKIQHYISFPSGESKSKKFIISPKKSKIKIEEDSELREFVYKSLSPYRALIVTPSFNKGKKWKTIDSDNIIETKSNNIIERIEEFKKSDNKKLILANRYDGIDFPGDSCRVLVFDGLPTEGELLNTYFYNQLKINNYIRSEINAKILQGVGRIFRGTDDYGVVILFGNEEVKWVGTPKNKLEFPKRMQIQLNAGNKLNDMIDETNLSELIREILSKDSFLMTAYEQFIDEETKKIEDIETHTDEENNLIEKISLIESHIYTNLWKRDFSQIEALCDDLVDLSKDYDLKINAWHYFISAIALSAIGNNDKSNEYYLKANSLESILPKILIESDQNFTESNSSLVNYFMQKIITTKKEKAIKDLNKQFEYMDDIKYPNKDKKHEIGIEYLGKVLGFKTERPDNSYKTGPDVLWKLSDNKYVILELKANKTTGRYSKKETSQFLDHVEWVKENKNIQNDKDLYKIIIGPLKQINKDANPSKDTWIIELKEFYEYGQKLINALKSSYSPSFNSTRAIEKFIDENNLDWDKAFEKMNKSLAVDLKS
ncbi:MAG: DEAD/DEAH box helicase family protein [Sulfurovum sp.]|nr:DEAD/DEAH box helicase family protein [Sulfurovum sp.]